MTGAGCTTDWRKTMIVSFAESSSIVSSARVLKSRVHPELLEQWRVEIDVVAIVCLFKRLAFSLVLHLHRHLELLGFDWSSLSDFLGLCEQHWRLSMCQLQLELINFFGFRVSTGKFYKNIWNQGGGRRIGFFRPNLPRNSPFLIPQLSFPDLHLRL